MKEDEVYVIFRKHGDGPPEFYGWSKTKKAVKVYLAQRSKSKYIVKKLNLDQMVNMYGESPESSMMIEYVMLKCKSTGEEVALFTTKSELCETEKRIQRYFRNLCSIIDSSPKASMQTVETYMMIDDYYKDALEMIGFNPPEIEAMFTPIDEYQYAIDGEIEDAYVEQSIPPDSGFQYDTRINEIPGLRNLTELHTRILYSLESFLKVMKDDM